MKQPSRLIKFLAVVFIVLLYYAGSYGSNAAGRATVQYCALAAKFSIPFGSTRDYNNIRVARAVDGDTLELENGERVRLIGIDTPEIHESEKLYRDSQRSRRDIRTIKELGIRSWQFTKNLVEGKVVSLEFDVERYDKYKRILAYVYLKDGTFVNAQIVKEGYADLLTIPPNVKYADLFLKLYREARENKRGLWQQS
jgi:micrococcal nuclease